MDWQKVKVSDMDWQKEKLSDMDWQKIKGVRYGLRWEKCAWTDTGKKLNERTEKEMD